MDKYEYKHLVDQIHYLIEQQEYAKAADIADTIDWRRVRSIMTLGTVSDLYRLNRRYEDARDIMLMAYDRKPESSQVCYSLCELFIKTGEMADAVEFYKEYERLTTADDYGRYILQYKMYEANNVSLEERAEVLENLRQIGYQEKWLYELAYLYHRMELETKCVEICDELILWFGEGEYVNKALELKRLHAPLTPQQQAKYDRRFEPEEFTLAEDGAGNSFEEDGLEEHTWEREQDTGEIFEPFPEEESADNAAGEFNGEEVQSQAEEYASPGVDTAPMVKIMDMGQYNTMNLQAEIAAGVNEVLGTDYVPRRPKHPKIDPKTGYYEIGSTTEILDNLNLNTEELSLIHSGDGHLREYGPGDEASGYPEENGDGAFSAERTSDTSEEENTLWKNRDADPAATEKTLQQETGSGDSYAGYVEEDPSAERADSEEGTIADRVMEQMRLESLEAQKKLENEALTAQPPEPMARALTQEPDGQIRLVIPEGKKLEKQITGQLSIEDIRAEWERMKQESREKQEEEVRQRVQRQTGKMFTEFEEALRDNILRQMEKKDDPSLFEMPEDSKETEGGAKETAREDDWTMDEWMSYTGEDAEEEPEGIAESAEESEKKPEEDAEISIELEKESEDTAEIPTGFEAESEEASESSAESAESEEEPEDKAEVPADFEERPEETIESSDESEQIPEEAAKAPEEYVEVLEDEIPSEGYGDEPEGEIVIAEAVPEELDEEPEAAGDVQVESEELPKGSEETSEVTEAVVTGDSWGEDDELPAFADEEAEPEEKAAGTEEPEKEVKPQEEPVVEEEPKEESGEIEEPKEHAEPGEESNAGAVEGASGEEQEEQKSDEEASQKASSPSVRSLTEEEETLFGEMVQDRSAREQLVKAIDSISMAAYAGNLVITSEENSSAMEMAKNMVREIKQTDSNFSGKAARISGRKMNGKKASEFLEQLKNGALIIDSASMLSEETLADLYKCMQQDSYGLLVILIDTKKKMNLFLKENKKFAAMFSARVDLQPLSNDVLAEYAQQYAREREFSIDDLGMLALHTRIDEMQTAKHSVTKAEVEEIMNAAMESAAKKNMGHFFDILVGRRYDDEDMIIITEKDFE